MTPAKSATILARICILIEFYISLGTTWILSAWRRGN